MKNYGTIAEKQQKIVDEWNAARPIGTPVTRYKLINPLEEPTETRTRSEAWLMGGHTAMVMVDGVAGGVMLESCKVRNVEFHDDKPSETACNMAVTTGPGDLDVFGRPLRQGR